MAFMQTCQYYFISNEKKEDIYIDKNEILNKTKKVMKKSLKKDHDVPVCKKVHIKYYITITRKFLPVRMVETDIGFHS